VSNKVDLFDSTYGNFADRVLQAVRAETFGEDIGQNSWLTVDELDRFVEWLVLPPAGQILEIACGAGGPALHVASRTGCRVSGIDANEKGIASARAAAATHASGARTRFEIADATAPLPFPSQMFDGLLCIDSMNHFPDRAGVLREWWRVLRPGGRAVFTDPVVVTGPVTNEELASRSSIGFFLFVPPGTNERLVERAGFHLARSEDVTDNIVLVSGRWLAARARHEEALVRIEGRERFEGLQTFFEAVHRLTKEKRLSRFVYVAEKPGT